MNKITTNVCPSTILRLGNNTYYYNYNILESLELTVDMKENSKEEIHYSFILVLLQGFPNYKDCVKAIIRQYVSEDEEFDLINSYNSYSGGLSDDETIISKYKDYLNTLKLIKAKVKEDFAKL